jgi:pentatricopeptide repeat protein
VSNSVTIVGVLNACGSLVALGEECSYAHEQRRLELDEIQMSVWTGLVDMYAKCGSMEDAWRVFNKLPSCNVVTWKAMVYTQCGHSGTKGNGTIGG